MRIVGRILAVLGLVALFLPWIEMGIHSDVGFMGYEYRIDRTLEQITVVDVIQNTVEHRDTIGKGFHVLEKLSDKFGIAETLKTELSLLILSSFLLLGGALLALATGGRAGHVIGLTGMVLFTLVFYPYVDRLHGAVRFSIGYYLGWISFGGGLILGGGSPNKAEGFTNKAETSEVSASLTAGQKAILVFILLPWVVSPLALIADINSPIMLLGVLAFDALLVKGIFDTFEKGASKGIKLIALAFFTLFISAFLAAASGF